MLKLGKGKKRKAVCGYRQYYRFRGNESGHPRHKLYRFSEMADPERKKKQPYRGMAGLSDEVHLENRQAGWID